MEKIIDNMPHNANVDGSLAETPFNSSK